MFEISVESHRIMSRLDPANLSNLYMASMFGFQLQEEVIVRAITTYSPELLE